MRIAHVLTLLDPSTYGGPTRVAYEQAEALARRGHDVELLGGTLGATTPIDTPPGVKVRGFASGPRLPKWRFSGLIAPGLLTHLVRHRDTIDILHIHFARDLIPLTTAHFAAACRIPYVLQAHGMIRVDDRLASRIVDRVATRRAMRHAAVDFYLTQREHAQLRHLIHDESRLAHLPNGIAIRPDRHFPDFKRMSRPNIVFCARLHPRKRPLAFVDMAADILARGIDVTFSMIGADAGDMERVRTRITALHLDSHVTLHGPMLHARVLEHLSNAAVYVLPSIEEPFPMTALEAMVVGTPVVLTDACDIATDLLQRKAAIITDGTPKSLADAVSTILLDQGARLDLQRNSIDAIDAVYNIDRVAEVAEHHYDIACRAGHYMTLRV